MVRSQIRFWEALRKFSAGEFLQKHPRQSAICCKVAGLFDSEHLQMSPCYRVKSEVTCLKLLFIATLAVSDATWLTLSWRRSLSYRNQSIELHFKSMDCFLYDRHLRYERVKRIEVINESCPLLYSLKGYLIPLDLWVKQIRSPLMENYSESFERFNAHSNFFRTMMIVVHEKVRVLYYECIWSYFNIYHYFVVFWDFALGQK